MKRFLLILFALPVFPALSQTTPGGSEPYLIPQTVFVGDKGRLALPLDSAFAGVEAAVIQGASLPRSRDLVINRVELERRGVAATLLVDFQAYVPGLVALPPIEIASHTFAGLAVTISSILPAERQGMILSGPAEPLAAPGTGALIYGSILGIILLFLALTLGSVWGKTRLRYFAERLKRRRVIRAMGRTLKQLRAASPGRDSEIPEILSRDFRVLLGIFTGNNCQAMVPSEFLSLDNLGGAARPEAVADLFRRCDILRFSGKDMERDAALALLDEFKTLALLLGAPEKDRSRFSLSGSVTQGEGGAG
ncbi:MAG: hypothetical protein LBK63_14360 [Treponema sp.]|jgi:hypothetical protein|nr:hypothetical protein [Treponema sp.]